MGSTRQNGGIARDPTTSPGADQRAGASRRASRPVLAVTLLALALLGAAAILIVATGDPYEPLVSSPAWMFPVISAGFFLAYLVVFHVEFRRESATFSLSEVPVAFALVFLGPVPAVLARWLGAMPPLLFRRPAPYKSFLNLAMFAFEMAVGITIVRAFHAPGDPADARMLLAVLVALLATLIISPAAVTIAIACFEGQFLGRLRAVLWSDGWLRLIGAGIAVAALAPALIEPWLAPLGLVPVVTTWIVLRAYGELTRRHHDLESLQGFTAAVSRSLSLDETSDAAVHELRELLRADRAALVVFDAGERRLDGADPVHVSQAGLPFAARTDDAAIEAYLRLTGPGDPYLLSPAQWPSACGPLPAAVRELMIAPMRDENSAVGVMILIDRRGVVANFDSTDLARMRAAAAQLRVALGNVVKHHHIEHEANHDPVTGRPNRSAFSREVDETLEAMTDDLLDRRSVAGVMVLGLDHLKEVTDTLGHQVGQRVLVDVAERLSTRLAGGDLLAALDGSEFAIFARRRSTEELTLFAQSLSKSTMHPFELDGLDVVITSSVGLALAEVEDDTATLLRHADVAMFHAKARHTGCETYRSDIDRETQRQNRLLMRGDLRDGLQRGEITVHYQPKLDVATGTVVGAEALARWSHPVRGTVSPLEFVSLAEETGLVKQLTDQVLSQAIDAVRQWRDAGFGLGVAVNVSTHDLLDESLADRVGRLLESHDVEPEALTLEITESSLLNDAPRTQATVDRLHELGLRLAVDDFGTGYSSLSYLRRLPVSELKIDGSFVWNLLLDTQDEVIVRSTIDLGHNLGLQVVAEGVENAPVIRRLEEMGCDIAQGFSISRPLPVDQFRTWLATTDFRIRRIDFPPARLHPRR